MVMMSRLFRYIMGSPNNKDEWVALSEEVEQIRRYLRIMEMRMGERLSWDIRLDPHEAAVPVPKLLIQPIVENAILHGVESRVGKGVIEVIITPPPARGGPQLRCRTTGRVWMRPRCWRCEMHWMAGRRSLPRAVEWGW